MFTKRSCLFLGKKQVNLQFFEQISDRQNNQCVVREKIQ